MKTIMTALVALTFTFSASAFHKHNAYCPINCPEAIPAIAPVAKGYEQKVNEIKLASENKQGVVNFTQTMQRSLNLLEKQKLQNAMENLEAVNAYNYLMANTLELAEQKRLADQLEDVAAYNRYENLMSGILMDTASIY